MGFANTHRRIQKERRGLARNQFRWLRVGWLGKEEYSALYDDLCDHASLSAQETSWGDYHSAHFHKIPVGW